MAMVSLGIRRRRIQLLYYELQRAGGGYALILFLGRRVKVQRLEWFAVDVDFLEAHDVVAAIDVDGLAGDAGATVGQQEGGGRTDFGGIDVAL